MENKKITWIFFVLLIISWEGCLGKTIDELIESKKRAMLSIITYDRESKKPLEIGAGFFIDNRGHFVTNDHILQRALSDPTKYLLQFKNQKGEEFENVEIILCGSKNKIDLCYGKIESKNKIYFFDIANKKAVKGQMVAVIGHNPDLFSAKKGEVAGIAKDIDEKYGTTFNDNKDVELIEISKYEYPNRSCKKDSGGAILDQFTGDVYGIFTQCVLSKKNQDVFKFGIEGQEIKNFILNIPQTQKGLKIKLDGIYRDKNKIFKNNEVGHEFDEELKNGKIE